MKQKRSPIMRILVLALPMLLIAGCRDGKEPAKKRIKPPPMVKIAKVEVMTLRDRLDLTGSVEPTRIARMASPVDGPVIACLVREGDIVRPGQLLTRLGRGKGDDATAAYALAELEREELDLGRIEKLVKTGALRGEDLDKARVRVSEKKAKLAHAKERLADYRIVAPWGGIVSKVHVAVGDFVSARTILIELFDPKSLVLRFAVPEKKAAQVQNAAAIKVSLDAYPDLPFTAAVTRIYPEIDRKTHTRIIEGSIEGNAALVPGMFARLELTLSSMPEALAVPLEAILYRGGTKTVVFVIKPEGVAEQRLVKTGIEDGAWIHILTGVKPDEQVAVAGHTRLRNGAKVRLAKEPARKKKGDHKKKSTPADAPSPGSSP